MTRAPKLRLLAILAVVASLAMTSLASPVFGALANIDIGGGSVANVTDRAATPTQVSPGNVAGFHLWVANNDSANLPTFFLNAATTADPVGAYWRFDTDPAGEFRPCTTNTDGDLMCSFGAFNSGQKIFIVAAFEATPSTQNCMPDPTPQNPDPQGFEPTTETSYLCVDFRFGANQGFVPGKNKSRGDDYHWYDFVATDGGADRGAQFPFCDLSVDVLDRDCDESLLTVFNTASANRRNVQATLVTAPDVNDVFDSAHGTSGIAVADGTAFTCPQGTPLCASHADEFLGQGSDVNVNLDPELGDADLGGALVYIKIQMYGVNPNAIDGVVHLWQEPDGVAPDPDWNEEVFTVEDDLCPEGPSGTDPCFRVTGSGNIAIVEIWSHNNGKFGHF